jgi:hypothetical protein
MQISTTVLRPGEGDLRAYASTLDRFLEVGAKTIYTGHGGPANDPAHRLRQLIELRAGALQRPARVAVHVGRGPDHARPP